MDDETKEKLRQKLKELDIKLGLDEIQLIMPTPQEQLKKAIKEGLEDPEFGPLFKDLFDRVAKLMEVNEHIHKLNEAIINNDIILKQAIYREITGHELGSDIENALVGVAEMDNVLKELLHKLKKRNKEIRGV